METEAGTALERAHSAYISAKHACSLHSRVLSAGIPREGETLAINWDFIEKHMRELANRRVLEASEMIYVLHDLRLEGRVLLEAALGCFGEESSPFSVSVAIAEAMTALDDAAEDLERELRERVWALEAGNKAAREHPELFCDPAKK